MSIFSGWFYRLSCLQIRSGASEYLYLVLQGTDIGRETDEVEEVLLETEW
jgi:hypothetical protein